MKKHPKTLIKLPSGASLDFSGPALVMAIINCNEDSFYAPSRALHDEAVEKAIRAEGEGASIIDFGGESSRPGSSFVSEKEELERVIPVIEFFRKRSSLPVSVDTRKAAVARAALEAGADIINDISALADDPDMAAVCAKRGAAVVLMHGGASGDKGIAAGSPDKNDPFPARDETPKYDDLVTRIGACLRISAEKAQAAGISREKIIIDPGFGFGKNSGENVEILRRLSCLAEICGKDYPILAGLSRKSFICGITGRDAAGSLPGTLAANGAAIMSGADIIRVHDVSEHRDLVNLLFALLPEH